MDNKTGHRQSQSKRACLEKTSSSTSTNLKRALSSGGVEDINSKIKALKRRCYGLSKIGILFHRICLDLKWRAAFA
ncbi:MAG: transposase [Blastocatellales bacterium]